MGFAALFLVLVACREDGGVDEADCVPGVETADDGIDQDCDGRDAVTDADGDGVPRLQDCDDHDATVFPGAAERCDGEDDDCDGAIPAEELDEDGDGVRVCEGDCDDGDRDVHPGANDGDPCDGIDRDCEGTAEDTGAPVTWYRDDDGDGHGDPDREIEACGTPEGYVEQADDCDDGDATVHPGAPDACDGVDSDCDEVEEDADGDGYLGCADDCDDTDPDDHPGAPELCDGYDVGCDGVLAAGEVDADGDGSLACEDCDDADPARRPGNVERCDDVDADCDGAVDEGCVSSCDVLVPNDHPTVQDGIDAASAGDLVCVGEGTWVENIDFGGAEITLWGVSGPELTILDGGADGSVVTFQSGEGAGAVLTGFTLTDGYGWDGGGGVAIFASSPTIEDVVVTGNEGAGYGGPGGGGVLVDGGAPTFTRVRVTDNDAWGYFCAAFYGNGGGFALYGADAVLEDVLVEDNWAGEAGGGLYASGGTLTLGHVAVTDNSAEGYGGGLYLSGVTTTLTHVAVTSNAASYDYWHDSHGGGLLVAGGSIAATQIVVAGNTADDRGGGLYVSSGTVSFTNVVIAGNSAADGDGVYVLAGTPTFAYSDLWDDVVVGITDPTGTDGNVSVDPEWADAAYHLDAASPLVDAGDPAILDPDGSLSDVGIFGGPGASGWDLDGDGYAAWWLPGAFDAATSPGADCDDGDATVYPGAGC